MQKTSLYVYVSLSEIKRGQRASALNVAKLVNFSCFGALFETGVAISMASKAEKLKICSLEQPWYLLYHIIVLYLN